ncbi:MAG TPA: hypothetical protein VI670_26090 [Thermoanaerobaculia bacterium]
MIQTSRESWRAMLPHLNEEQLAAAEARFARYVRLALEIVHSTEDTLTEPPVGGSVNAGQVEPCTFKNTG